METAIRHTHLFAVMFFLLIYFVKTMLLLSNKSDVLAKFTKIVKVPEMIISFLFLATGVYLVYAVGATTLILIKIVMVLTSIPLAIVGFKKSNKILATIALLLIIGSYGIAEVNKKKIAKQTIDPSLSDVTAADYNILVHGKNVYNAYCLRCHGIDGFNGAMGLDLKNTQLDKSSKIVKIMTGAGSMPAFKEVLTSEELEAVVTYIEGFKN
jgi:cytochrome c5